MANLLTTDTELTQVANAIRSKGGTSAQLGFPDDFVDAVAAIAPVTENIDAANIKAGVTVKVGDPSNAGKYKNVAGTFTADATATANDIKWGSSAYVNGQKINGGFEIFDTECRVVIANTNEITIGTNPPILYNVPFTVTFYYDYDGEGGSFSPQNNRKYLDIKKVVKDGSSGSSRNTVQNLQFNLSNLTAKADVINNNSTSAVYGAGSIQFVFECDLICYS